MKEVERQKNNYKPLVLLLLKLFINKRIHFF